MRINITKMGISLDQSKYAAEIIKKFYYPGSPIYTTPMDVGAVTSLAQNQSDKLEENERLTFLSLLGKLNWLCNTRPDILFAVHKLKQFSSTACKQHWRAALRIVGYIAGTIQYGLIWERKSPKTEISEDIHHYNVGHVIETYAGSSKAEEFRAFSDADFAGDPTDS